MSSAEKTEDIAGHTFTLSRDAVCTKLLRPGSDEICGKSWQFVKTATPQDIGKADHPHSPHLTANEYSQIVARREREEAEDAAIWAAVVGVCGR